MAKAYTGRTDNLVAALSFIAFIALGIASTTALLGVAWPSMAAEFGLPLDAVALLFLVHTAGYILASFYSGRLMVNFGTARTFLAAMLLITVGMFGIALGSWPIAVVVSFVAGLGSGTVDAGLNNYIAAHYGPRPMNWLHAFFGVGVLLGPLIMTALISRDVSWRYGYVVASALALIVAVAVFMSRAHWRDLIPETPAAKAGAKGPGLVETLRVPMVWLGLAVFVALVGMELGVGQWAFTLLTGGRGVPAQTAGHWVTFYWAMFTVGRVFFGIIGDRLAVVTLLRLAMVLALLGALLLWLNLGDAISFVGLMLLGFAQAPLFPLLTLETARRVGARHATNAIGMQVSAAGVGAAFLPGLGGAIAERQGPMALAPFFFGMTALVFVLHEVTLLWRAEPERAATVSGAD